MKRNRILLVVLVAALIGGLAWLVLREPREPVYQGKALSAWLEAFSTGIIITDFSDPSDGRLVAQIEAQKAVRAVGTNAVPILLRMAGARDSSIKSRLLKVLGKQSMLHFKFRTATESHELAFFGFLFLGSVGKPAIPQLISLLNDSDPSIRRSAAASLGCVGNHDTNAVHALVNHLNDRDEFVRKATTNALAKIDPELAAKAEVQ